MFDHTSQPDVETSSDDYARRFAGPIGDYFLDVQRQTISTFLASSEKLHSVLDVGGGHGQLTELLLQLTDRLTIHGSTDDCFLRLRTRLHGDLTKIEFTASPLLHLPFPDREFDAVFAFRLLAHIEDWKAFLAELARVSRRYIIFDYASLWGFNTLTPLLFQIKKRIEGNTRPYFCHRAYLLRSQLSALGFTRIRIIKQFFFPMALHRALNNRSISRPLEAAAAAAGLTRAFGSPAVVSAQRD